MYHPLDALFDLQKALEARLDSDWLRGATGGGGAYPPINVFQQGESLIAASYRVHAPCGIAELSLAAASPTVTASRW